jgi:hypothetical protein
MTGMSRDRAGTIVTAAVASAFAGWVVISAGSQHAQRSFDRLRRLDPLGIFIPNWRFFAPEPAQHDFHVLYRVLTEDGGSAWEDPFPIAPRKLRHVVWFPGRRREKALVDVVTQLMHVAGRPGFDMAETTPYRIIRDVVAEQVRQRYRGSTLPLGFQFTLVRFTGHDESGEPEYVLTSPYEPLEECETAP